MLIVFLVSLCAPAAHADDPPQADDPPPAKESPHAAELAAVNKEAAAKLLAEMYGLAEWCEELKLLKERDRCAEILIKIDPEHADARKWLKYSKNRNGEWVQRAYKIPKNYDEFNNEPVAQARYDTAFAAYLDAVVGAVQSFWKEMELPDRRLAVKDLMVLGSEDERVRDLNGEVLVDGAWRLKETKNSRERQNALKTAARKHLDGVEPAESIDATDEENALGVFWGAALKGKNWRALGTIGEAELENALKVAEATRPLMDEAFAIEFMQPRACGFYLINGKKEAKTILTAHPDFKGKNPDFLVKLASAWIGRTPVFLQWSDSPDLRLDGTCRQVIGLLILRRFGLDTRQGWVWEGFGLYIDYLLTGTRLTTTVTPEYTTTLKFDPRALLRRMQATGADWLELARGLASADQAPDLTTMMKKQVNQLDHRDILFSYALAAYLLEGWPEHAAEFLSRLGSRQDFDPVTRDVFELEFAEFEEHFHRWLNER